MKAIKDLKIGSFAMDKYGTGYGEVKSSPELGLYYAYIEKKLIPETSEIHTVGDMDMTEEEEKKYTMKEVTDIILDMEIPISIEQFFDENGESITKKKYGCILIQKLCEILNSH